MTRLTIVIVSYNSRRDVEQALRSISEPPPSIAHEIVIVDNASSDETVRYLSESWPRVRLIASEINLGFARANNLAIRNTTGELVLFLNPDTIASADAVERLVATLDGAPDVAVVGPRIVDGEGRAELSFGAMITPWAELRQKILVRGHARRVGPISRLVERMTRTRRYVDWVSGACLLIRRSELAAAGCFDERFFMYAEDVDLCAAVRGHGKHVLFAPTAQVVHLRGRSAASAPLVADAAYRRSQLAFYAKHKRAWLPVVRLYLKLRGRLPDTPQ